MIPQVTVEIAAIAPGETKTVSHGTRSKWRRDTAVSGVGAASNKIVSSGSGSSLRCLVLKRFISFMGTPGVNLDFEIDFPDL